MDVLSLLRTLGGLAVVLGLLAGALWVVRRYDIKLPGRVGGGSVRRLELVERLTIDAKRSVALVRRDGCEHLILLDPTGATVIESMIEAAIDRDRATGRAPASAGPATDGGEEPTAAPRPTYDTVAVEEDALSFRAALGRIQEKARRARKVEAALLAQEGAEPVPQTQDGAEPSLLVQDGMDEPAHA